MIRMIVLLFAVTGLALSASAQTSEAEQVRRDAWALERIAEVSSSGRAMPRDLMQTMVSQSLETLRGASPDGTYRWASYERAEAGRDADRDSLRPTGSEEPDSLESTTDLAYAIRIEVPSRRLLVARNRRVFIERIDVDYRELGGFRDIQTIELNRWIEPGDSVEYPLESITRRATATVRGWADPEERGNAVVEVVWLVPTLTDDPASPYATQVATLKQVEAAVDERDRERTRTLAAQLAMQLGHDTTPVMRPDLVREPPAVPMPIGRDELLFELRTLEEMMRSGAPAGRGTAEDRLRNLIRRVESLPIR